MAYLRELASEFHKPDDIHAGALLNMPYLAAMDRYQHYLDGDLNPLFQWASRGGAKANQLNGMRFFTPSESPAPASAPEFDDNRYAALWRINFFRSVTDFFEAAVFEQSPIVIDASDAVKEQWDAESRAILRQARRATRWLVAKGRGVLTVENRVGPGASVVPSLSAVDPAFWLPILDPEDRTLKLGDILARQWFEGERQMNSIANRLTTTIRITEEQAAMSDGRFSALDQRDIWTWPGGYSGNIGEHLKRTPSRTLGIWTWGDDDSVFAEMESNTLEAMLTLTMARSTMMRHPFPFVILPNDVSDRNRDQQGNFEFDQFDPIVYASLTQGAGGGNIFGYQENPAPGLSQGFLELASISEEFLAYVASSPKEAFGLSNGTEQHEGALNHLQQIFKTKVIDTRDELTVILPLIWELLGGPSVRIEWEHEPFAQTQAWRAEVRSDVGTIITPQAGGKRLGYAEDEIIQESTETTDPEGDPEPGPEE